MVSVNAKTVLKSATIKLFLAVMVLAAAAVARASEPVGHVMMVVGEAVRVAGDGAEKPLTEKSAVYEGDTVKTGAAARLQLKMVDSALLVFQPESSLVISQYRFDAAQPAENAARLDLVKGRVRSVTGELGEANHDAFRLNTPIAAIGIRGTDFETTTSQELTRVRLNSGAIVISPLGENCPAAALGPCTSDNSLLLTEDLESPVAELKATDAAPRIIELPDYESDDQGSLNEQSEEEQINADNRAEEVIGAIENSVRDRVFTPPPVPADWQDEIHWGRWTSAPESVNAPDYGVYTAEGKELLFINDLFVLFRDGFVSIGRGQASFELQNAQAGILAGDSYTPVTVADGSLMIDFDDRTFSTGLEFGSGSVNGLTTVASGTIDSRGLFRSDQGTMTVRGGLTEGNDQAGYLFSHTLDSNSSLQGAAQWLNP